MLNTITNQLKVTNNINLFPNNNQTDYLEFQTDFDGLRNCLTSRINKLKCKRSDESEMFCLGATELRLFIPITVEYILYHYY